MILILVLISAWYWQWSFTRINKQYPPISKKNNYIFTTLTDNILKKKAGVQSWIWRPWDIRKIAKPFLSL